VQECLPDCWNADPTQWTPLQRWSVQAAAAILKRLSGGQFNLCPITIRPCRRTCPPERYRYLGDPIGLPWIPAMLDGKIYNLTCGVCRDECGCGPLQEIILDPFARAIIQVKVDGNVLPSTAYRVDDYRKLVRLDGGEWPDCQYLDRPDTEPETWSVSYWTGNEPDFGASFALTDLAVEWWKACQGKPCALGENVKAVTRQGITYDMDTVYESIREGRTGIKRVDLWLYSVNPHGLRRRLRVYSPDTVHGRRTTWPAPGAPGPGPGPDPQELAFSYIQSKPEKVWLIPHPLPFEPAGVRVMDLAGEEIRGEVGYPDPHTVQISFNQPVAGRARLS
jgi:hypothetical protein